MYCKLLIPNNYGLYLARLCLDKKIRYMKTEKENSEFKIDFSIFFKMALVVIVIWVVSAVAIYYLIPNWGDRGTLGDMFGAVNALYSGLAFAGLLFTIVLQRQEIKMNRHEIELNRKELKKSTAAQTHSQKALQEQAIQTHLTAKINAMSTVINYYNIQISSTNNSPETIDKARAKRRELIAAMDDLIDGLNDSDVDE